MFMSDRKRIKEKAFSVKIVKICRYVGIKERSMHKARKTYATKLINGGVDESLVIKQMGHTSIDWTRNHYYFNNKSDEEAVKQIIEKEYAKKLKGEIVYIGLAHCGKEVEVKWIEK